MLSCMRQQGLFSPAIPYCPCTECKHHISKSAIAYCSNDVNMLRNNKCNDVEEYHKAYDGSTCDKCYSFVHNVNNLNVNIVKKL